MRAGFCGGFVAQWLWRLQSDTLDSSRAVAVFSLFSFLSEQVGFRLNFHESEFVAKEEKVGY